MLEAPNATGRSMAEQLQQLTELLAAAHTQEEVLSAALGPAIAALGALSGAVLLLDAEGRRLNVVAHQGQSDDRTVWQDGPLDPELPSGDAVLRQQALYFEHSGDMAAAYPRLEEKTGGVAAVGSALLPLLLDGRVLGVLILDFKEPHPFTPDERRFLPTLARQTSVALNRVQLLLQRAAEADRFRRMVEASPVGIAVGSLDGGLTLVNDAYLHLLEYTRQEFERGEIDWQALTPPEYRAQDGRAFEAAFSRGVSTTYEKEMLSRGGERLPVGLTLIRYDDQQVVGYVQDLRVQKAQVQALRSEGERLTRQVAEGTTALEAEQAAMQLFVQFTEAAGQITDLDELARLALDTLQALIPGANVALTELTPTHWALRHWTDNLDPELLAMTRQHGFPLSTPVFSELLASRQPVFTNGWDETEQEVAHSGQFQAVAHYPVMQEGRVVAAIGLAVADRQVWTEAQKAIIRSVGRSFTLLYDRISTAEQLRLQREEAQGRAQVLEAFMLLTRDRVDEADTLALIRRAQELVLSLLPPGLAAYYEPVDGRWRLRVQTGDAGTAALQAAMGAGFPLGETPSFDQVARTQEPSFVDVYAGDTDVDAEIAGHIAAHASLPLMAHGQVRGIFNVPLFEARRWAPADRALLTTAVHSLGLVIERAERASQLAQANQKLEERTRMLDERTGQLERSNDELLAANEELEAFTYSASHDLRTPVRHVMGFAELAQKALEKTPNDKAQQHLDVVKQGALRMTALIDDMLLLSRSGRQELHVQPVDLNLLVTQARRDAAAEFADHPVRWQIGPLPQVQGDHNLLQQVMTNLLSNAVKYSAKRGASEVEVWCEERGTEWRISVKDNGVGFDPAYAPKLFGIFQRLHSERDFKGTGVGLATVKRIVQKHGGRVFAESDGQTGATFGFTLPK